MTGAEIAECRGMALSTVSGILTRIGMGRLRRLGLEPAQRTSELVPANCCTSTSRTSAGLPDRNTRSFAAGQPGPPRATTVVLYTIDVASGPEQAQIVKNDLARIGIQVQIHTFPSTPYSSLLLANPRAPFDLAYDGWLADYPDPDDFSTVCSTITRTDPRSTIHAPSRHSTPPHGCPAPERCLTCGALDLDLARNAAPWPLVATARAVPSSRRGLAARRSGSTGWTLPRCARELPPHSDQKPRPDG